MRHAADVAAVGRIVRIDSVLRTCVYIERNVAARERCPAPMGRAQ